MWKRGGDLSLNPISFRDVKGEEILLSAISQHALHGSRGLQDICRSWTIHTLIHPISRSDIGRSPMAQGLEGRLGFAGQGSRGWGPCRPLAPIRTHRPAPIHANDSGSASFQLRRPWLDVHVEGENWDEEFQERLSAAEGALEVRVRAVGDLSNGTHFEASMSTLSSLNFMYWELAVSDTALCVWVAHFGANRPAGAHTCCAGPASAAVLPQGAAYFGHRREQPPRAGLAQKGGQGSQGRRQVRTPSPASRPGAPARRPTSP